MKYLKGNTSSFTFGKIDDFTGKEDDKLNTLLAADGSGDSRFAVNSALWNRAGEAITAVEVRLCSAFPPQAFSYYGGMACWGGSLYAADRFEGKIKVYSLTTFTKTSEILVPGIKDLAIASGVIYAACGSTIKTYDTSLSPLDTYNVSADKIFACQYDVSTVYVVTGVLNNNKYTISVYSSDFSTRHSTLAVAPTVFCADSWNIYMIVNEQVLKSQLPSGSPELLDYTVPMPDSRNIIYMGPNGIMAINETDLVLSTNKSWDSIKGGFAFNAPSSMISNGNDIYIADGDVINVISNGQLINRFGDGTEIPPMLTGSRIINMASRGYESIKIVNTSTVVSEPNKNYQPFEVDVIVMKGIVPDAVKSRTSSDKNTCVCYNGEVSPIDLGNSIKHRFIYAIYPKNGGVINLGTYKVSVMMPIV